MRRENLLAHPSASTEIARVPHHRRRDFVKGLGALASSAALLGYDFRLANADPPPEITKLRIHESGVTCIAPQLIAQELLHAEGFTDVQYVNFPKDTKLWPPETMLVGEVDINFSFAPTSIGFLDTGAPLAILAAAHNGCVELVARKDIRSTRDLKGKTVNAPVIDAKVFISMFVAYVGLDPEKDINWTSFQDWDDQIPFLQQGKIDAFMAGPPGNLEMREKGIGHVLVSTTTDKPWVQHACCLVACTKEFVRKYPVATKRALRAMLKGVDLCATDPSRVARVWADRGLGDYDLALQVLRELPYGQWRDINVVDSLRFWALRMHDVGAIKSSPQKIIEASVDLRFLNELKKELKA